MTSNNKTNRIKVGKQAEKYDKSSRNKTVHSQHFEICGIIKFEAVRSLWHFLTTRFQLCETNCGKICNVLIFRPKFAVF